MSDRTTNKGSRNPLLRAFMLLVAIVFVGPVQLGKWLNGKAYKDLGLAEGAFCALLTVLSGYFLGTQTVAYLHEQTEMPMWGAVLLGVLSFIVTTIYLFPAVWLVAIRPVYDLTEWLREQIRLFCKSNAKAVADVVVLRVLPGSGRVWAKINGDNQKSWFVGIQYVIVFPSLLIGCGYFGWEIYSALHALAGTTFLGVLLSALAGVLAYLIALTVWVALSSFLSRGKVATMAIYLGVGLLYVTGAYMRSSLTQLGLTGWYPLLAYPVVFVLFVGYAYPVITLVLSNAFAKWVYDVCRPQFDKAYDDKETPFRHLFHQLFNLATTAAITYGMWWLTGALGLPFAAMVLVTVVSLYLSFNLVGEVLDWDGGNYILGALLALSAGGGAFFALIALQLNIYLAIVAAVVTATFTFFVAYPNGYLFLRLIFNLPLIRLLTNALGNGLREFHRYFWDRQFQKVIDAGWQIYRNSYGDQGQFGPFMKHLANIVFAGGLGLMLYVIGTYLAFGSVALYVVIGVCGVLSYLLMGKFVFKESVAVGATVALATGLAVGAVVRDVQPFGMLFALPFGLTVTLLTYLVFYPLGYLFIRLLIHPWLTQLLFPVLDFIFEKLAWGLFQVVWDTFTAMYNSLVEFLSPYWASFVGFLARSWSTLTALLNKVINPN